MSTHHIGREEEDEGIYENEMMRLNTHVYKYAHTYARTHNKKLKPQNTDMGIIIPIFL